MSAQPHPGGERHCLFLFMGWRGICLVYLYIFSYSGSYTPTRPGNSWAVTHAGAGLTGRLWDRAALGSCCWLFPKGSSARAEGFALAAFVLPPSMAGLGAPTSLHVVSVFSAQPKCTLILSASPLSEALWFLFPSILVHAHVVQKPRAHA